MHLHIHTRSDSWIIVALFKLLFCTVFCAFVLIVPDALARSLSDLLALVKLLREDVAHQRQEIAYLRMLLENCAGCKEPSGDNNIRLEPNCRTANPCYPGKWRTQYQLQLQLHLQRSTILSLLPTGVDCHDSASGPRCGRCPAGLIGDGKLCKPGVSCADRPCFL